MIRVFIFLNDGYRDVLVLLLNHVEDITIVGASGNADTLLQDIDNTRPDVILMGHSSRREDSLQIEKIKSIYPKKKVVVFTNSVERSVILQSIEAGADGYVLLNTPLLKLKDYIHDAYEGGAPMSPLIARQILSVLSPVNNVHQFYEDGLTTREIDILRLLVKGYSYKMISSDLKISLDTVRSHIKNIYSKLNVNSKSEVIIKVLKDRLIC